MIAIIAVLSPLSSPANCRLGGAIFLIPTLALSPLREIFGREDLFAAAESSARAYPSLNERRRPGGASAVPITVGYQVHGER
jgi:hypothetical protein